METSYQITDLTYTEANDGMDAVKALVLVDGVRETLLFTESHPSWDSVNFYIKNFQDEVITAEDLAEALHRLYNVAETVNTHLSSVTVGGVLDGRMKIENGKVTVDHDPVDPAIEAFVLRMLDSRGEVVAHKRVKWVAFVKFIEKLYANMNTHVREQFFGWLTYEVAHSKGFTLTPEGNVLAYKGLMGTPANPLSIHAGPGWVDGVFHNGHLSNKVGSVVEMQRSMVDFDPAVGCSTGLHVGTWDYASCFAQGVIALVEFNPVDLVSVPTDCEAQKCRVARYKVVEIIKAPLSQTVYSTDADWSTSPVEDDSNADILGLLNKRLGGEESFTDLQESFAHFSEEWREKDAEESRNDAPSSTSIDHSPVSTNLREEKTVGQVLEELLTPGPSTIEDIGALMSEAGFSQKSTMDAIMEAVMTGVAVEECDDDGRPLLRLAQTEVRKDSHLNHPVEAQEDSPVREEKSVWESSPEEVADILAEGARALKKLFSKGW